MSAQRIMKLGKGSTILSSMAVINYMWLFTFKSKLIKMK